MLKCMARVCPFIFLRSRKGSTLLEVLIAIAVLGLIAASILPVFIMLNKAEFKWTQQTVAESLIRTQVEYIKGCPYILGNSSNSISDGNITVLNPVYSYATVLPPDPTYEIVVIARPVQIDTSTNPPSRSYLPAGQYENVQPSDKRGIQEIHIDIYHVDNLVTSVTNYKVDRP
jgi:prepilin-type N-terminal cleavage/methylation domain-containing protein